MRSMRTISASRRLGTIAVAALLAACNNYISPTSSNPNAVPAASVDQLFTSGQLNAFFSAEDNVNRLTSIWMQQMAGTDRQFSIFDTYVVKESDISTEFNDRYTGGGLIDLRRAETLASAASRPAYLGILQTIEAYQMGMTASIWGDIPYSEAANPDIKAPKLDKQEEVYAAVQALLDDAISNLAKGSGDPGAQDLSFGGDPAAWAAVAHTLKARYYMHWVEAQNAGRAEADVACGGNCVQKALAQTALGIRSASGDWRSVHSTAQTETNIWFQFMNDRSGYMSAGQFMVNLLAQRNDPRLQYFYAPNGQGKYVGSAPGQNLNDASVLNRSTTGAADYGTPIVTCAENALIAAEAAYYMNDVNGARQGLDEGIRCQEQADGLTLVHPTGLTGTALLNEIMTQKYFALFLNEESWNDYKRTCLPVLATYQSRPIPGRLIYGEAERQTNPNVPPPSEQPLRNTNDPQACSGA